MKKNTRKMSLARESIRILSSELGRVQGGNEPPHTNKSLLPEDCDLYLRTVSDRVACCIKG